eukprot:TRINITY_DN6011_c0_g1_i1.p1 TRINITY_DN6011_c0_g1~~TRINITY_DN6011_c0_g1_i1.p1  ORF type:complete len:588 (+),score=129.73 TRINITY_DN6011_c0_g1_i1:44-1807(+)
MVMRILAVYPLLAIAAFADTSTCNVNLLQWRLELSAIQESSAKHHAATQMPDVVTAATFLDAAKPTNVTSAKNTNQRKLVYVNTKNSSKKKSENAKKNASSDNATSAENKSENGTNNTSSDGNINATLPLKAARVFDGMEEKNNQSGTALASAKDLIDEFKKQTALENTRGEKAAIAEAKKLDALKQMNDTLGASMDLQQRLMHGLSYQAAENQSDTGTRNASSDNVTSAENKSENGMQNTSSLWNATNTTNATSAENQSENGTTNSSSDNAASAENKSENGTNNTSSDGNINATLPLKAARVFDGMEEKFNQSETALASAKDLIDEFKKQTALEITWGEKAALAEAKKLDALKQINDSLGASMDLQQRLMHGLSYQASSLLPKQTERVENLSAQAALGAVRAAKLQQVVSLAEADYTVALAGAIEARLKRNNISARLQSLLDVSMMNELSIIRDEKLINNMQYLNLSGNTTIVVRGQGDLSSKTLADMVQADIDKYYPSSAATSTAGTTSTTDQQQQQQQPQQREQLQQEQLQQPRIIVQIVKEEASDGKDKDKSGDSILPSLPYIIGLALLLGVILAGIAIMRGN